MAQGDRVRPIPFFLVTGFLGSGKTSFAAHLLSRFGDGLRLGVVQNEFAAGAVDGETLRRTGRPFSLLEVNRGSVFCACLLSDFRQSLAAFADAARPDAVLLEATGLADPLAVAEIVHAPELGGRFTLAHAWCLVDAVHFLRLENALPQVVRQVRAADTVAVNKTDLAGPGAAAAVEARVRELNPAAEVVRTEHGRIPLAAFPPEFGPAGAGFRPAAAGSPEPCGRPAVGSAVVKTARALEEGRLRRFLEAQAEGLWRVKGFVRIEGGIPLSVQGGFGRVSLSPAAGYEGLTQLIALGPALRQDAFAAAFRASCIEPGRPAPAAASPAPAGGSGASGPSAPEGFA
jgi:G3E family GTPase